MIHVDGRSMVVMDTATDRMRLKDKIVANVAKAVKSIQELQILAGNRHVILGNYDWQCHRLCEHIDHTLLHGLRHVTPGYWKIVSEFTHRDCVKEIKRMLNVTTDLGKGRAWLLMALNEGLLECYLQCYTQNSQLVEDYYVKDALVRDQDRFNVLLTLTSGLENVSFSLDCDVPYLDLCVYPPKSRHKGNMEATIDFDKVSICSMESVHMASNKHLPQTVFEGPDSSAGAPDTCSVGSSDSSRRHSPSLDSGVHSDWNYKQRSVTPIDQLGGQEVWNHDVEPNAELEVIRVTKKGKSGKSKKKKKKSFSVSDLDGLDQMDNAADKQVITIPPLDDFKLLSAIKNSQNNNYDESVSDLLNINGSPSETDVRSPGDGVDLGPEKSNSPTVLESDTNGKEQVDESVEVNGDVNSKSNRDSGIFTDMIKARVSSIVTAGEVIEKTVVTGVDDENDDSFKSGDDSVFEKSEVENSPKQFDEGRIGSQQSVEKGNANEAEVEAHNEESSIYNRTYESDVSDEEISATLKPGTESSRKTASVCWSSSKVSLQSEGERGSSCNTEDANALDLNQRRHSNIESSQTSESPSMLPYSSSYTDRRSAPPLGLGSRTPQMQSGSFHGNTSDTPSSRASVNSPQCQSVEGDRLSVNTNSDSDYQGSEQVLEAKVEELISQRRLHQYTHLAFSEEEEEESEVTRDRSSSFKVGEVELDNNTMLCLMLDVMDGDESFVKMFLSRQGHTEGKTTIVYVLITTGSLYFLQHMADSNRFQALQRIPFNEIDFVSLGYNSQLLHIACKGKRQRHWLTTGDERVTIALVDCVASSMEKCESRPGKLEVDTGNTVQKISLHKYVAQECRCEIDEAAVVSYSLVHWEDPQSQAGSCEWDRHSNLYYKSNETTTILGTQTWRLAYAVFQDCMLCLYNDKNDPKPVHFLSLSEGECVGCKRDFNSDRNNCIRIMLADGTYWSIALATEGEANSWLQGLCQAVAEGLKMTPVRTTCIACCMVLSSQQLFMCHEDLDTNFLRTLGRARLEDITSVLVDQLDNTFIILAFDSPEETISSEKWVLYFNSEHECSRFKQALSDCWATHFQIDLPVDTLEVFALQKKCREVSQHLRASMTPVR